MPFIDAKITVPVSAEQKTTLKSAFGKAIPTLHKSESYLMVGIEDSCDLWMAGQKLDRGAYVSVSLFGGAKSSDYDNMTGKICRILKEQLDIPGEDVYVTYHPVSDWGWNGSNF